MQSWSAESGASGALFVRQCGWQQCESGHQYGPSVRDHHLIHFVASGEGRFWTREREYRIGAGQGFIIFPGQVTTYRAGERQPWTYCWVGYSGSDAPLFTQLAGLSAEEPVFECSQMARAEALVRQMGEDAAGLRLGALAALGALQQLLALIGQDSMGAGGVHHGYYQKAMWFMEGHYARSIGIEDVARFVGLSRSQLFRVFQQAAGESPKACLIAIRMGRAKLLLEQGGLTLPEVAASVGLSSAARLGVLFKETFGQSPGQYRKSHETGRA